MRKITFDRQQLYKKVWEKPVSHISLEIGVTCSKIHRVCRKLNIPKPTAGEWVKMRHGNAVEKRDLPECDKETVTLWVEEYESYQKSN